MAPKRVTRCCEKTCAHHAAPFSLHQQSHRWVVAQACRNREPPVGFPSSFIAFRTRSLPALSLPCGYPPCQCSEPVSKAMQVTRRHLPLTEHGSAQEVVTRALSGEAHLQGHFGIAFDIMSSVLVGGVRYTLKKALYPCVRLPRGG